MLKIGDTAPDFTLVDSSNNQVSLSDFYGKKHVILYFYPKDDTPACTVEAQGFSERQEDYAQLDAVVLGISKDTVRSHERFCRKYGLSLTLLADPQHQVIEQYGAWQLKKFMGREFMGTVRTTFLIDKIGKIRRVWPNVEVMGHVQEVLEAVQSLTGKS